MADTETVSEDKVADVPEASASTVASGEDHPAPEAPIVMSHQVGAFGRAYRLSQRLLVVGGTCVALFSVYETYSNQPAVEPLLRQLPFDAVQAPVVPGDVSLAETIDRYERRRIFGPPPPDEPPPEDGTRVVRGWRAEVRENWALKGTSAIPGTSSDGILEAIVFDNRTQGLQFLRVGQIVQISEQDVEIVRIGADRVELRREDEVLVLD